MKIYLATRYSSSAVWPINRIIEHLRFRRINKIAAGLMRQGHYVYSPISHTHPIAKAGKLPKGFSFWEEYDRSFIEDWCDELWINATRGWHKSTGIKAEKGIAEEAGKRVLLMKGEGK